MTVRIVIVGAGGFGREVQNWLQSSPRWRAQHDVGEVVFVDDSVPGPSVQALVVATVANYHPQDRDLVICAVGSPEVRRLLVERLADRGARFATFVHDSALVGDRVTLGEGAVICPNVVMTSEIEVGKHVHINTNCTIGHDVVVGDFVTLSSACNLTGGVTVGDDAFLATAVSVAPGKTIGTRAYIGIGSVVVRNVVSAVTVFGNPSRIIGRRDS